MRKLYLLLKKNLPLVLIIIISFSLRFINLGYSDYQGDEIKAFLRLAPGQSVAEFLLNQRKGPGQFFITSIIQQFDSTFSNEFLFRLPFALAGALAVYFFYKFLVKHFDNKIAFYASFFFATNGFFLALSRIVQYQAFVILFMVLTLYMFTLAVTEEGYRYKGLFFGFFFWVLSMLFHYDGIFIFPFAVFLVGKWFKDNVKQLNKRDPYFRFFLVTLLTNGIFLSLFYVPFVFNISQNTLQYWGGRLSGDVSAKISSSKYLFTVYQPIYVVHFYVSLFLLGSFYFGISVINRFVRKYNIVKVIPKLTFSRFKVLFIFLWFLLPFIFLEIIVYIPGTHIYNYLLPMTVILAFGIKFVEESLKIFSNMFIPEVISFTGLFVLFTFIYLQSYAVFVDNSREYPWESEKFLIWEFPQPTPIYHLSMFGFPYYRNWEGIRDAIMSSDSNGFYSTNERKSIARFFVPFEKSTDKAGHFIHIINPQSFTNKIQQEKAVYWSERYHPIFTFSRSGKDLVRVYYMETGTLEEIIAKGY